MDLRNKKLAEVLVNYSCRLKEGEKVMINANGTACFPLVKQIIKEVYRIGAIPFVNILSNEIDRELLLGATKEQCSLMAEFDSPRMQAMDAYIGIRCNDNTAELADVPSEKTEIYDHNYTLPVHYGIRLKKKWVVLRYPNASLAQAASTSLEAFEDFFYKVCNLDYSKMSKAMDSLVELMEKTDKVRIVGNGTDISFSIKGMPAIKCDGRCNIPDGEVYTAPIKDSVNGIISYNAPTEYNDICFDNVTLEFKDGKIIKATANDTKKANEIFDTDEGARYVGEFAIGVNPYITKPMRNILFDEKISGSIHFTPGNSYDDADNTNKSAIHWDLVLIQTEEYGGGEIYFDDVLIRKNGIFTHPALLCLNPENLI